MWMLIGILSFLATVLIGYGIYCLVKKNGKVKKTGLAAVASFVLFLVAVVNDTPSSPSNNQAQKADNKQSSQTATQTATQPTIAQETKPFLQGRSATVVKVVDGDTVELEGGEKVRLIGVNTPETVKPNTPEQPYGKEASAFTKSQLEGKKVFLETGIQTKDNYGRTLAYLYIQEPKNQDDLKHLSSKMFTTGIARKQEQLA